MATLRRVRHQFRSALAMGSFESGAVPDMPPPLSDLAAPVESVLLVDEFVDGLEYDGLVDVEPVDGMVSLPGSVVDWDSVCGSRAAGVGSGAEPIAASVGGVDGVCDCVSAAAGAWSVLPVCA
jgi:hypothetical protein